MPALSRPTAYHAGHRCRRSDYFSQSCICISRYRRYENPVRSLRLPLDGAFARGQHVHKAGRVHIDRSRNGYGVGDGNLRSCLWGRNCPSRETSWDIARCGRFVNRPYGIMAAVISRRKVRNCPRFRPDQEIRPYAGEDGISSARQDFSPV